MSYACLQLYGREQSQLPLGNLAGRCYVIEEGSFWQSWGCGSWPRPLLNAGLLLNLKFLLLWRLHGPDPGGSSQNSAVLGEGLECWHLLGTPWAIHCTFLLTLIPIFLSFLFLSVLCDLQTFGIDTLIQYLWRTFPMTETWGIIHCHKRRNNTGVVQGVCSGRVVVELFRQILPLSSLHCLMWGQHKTQHCLNPSTAALLGTMVTF